MTDLNRDALEKAAISHAESSELVEWYEIGKFLKQDYLDQAEEIITAYFGALTVTTVEELDALPLGTVVYASNCIGAAERFEEGWFGCGNAAAWSSAILARHGLPARVLHTRR